MCRFRWCLCLFLALVFAGCSSNSKPAYDCKELTVSQCLNQKIYIKCLGKVQDLEDQCNETLQANAEAAKKEFTLVPELMAYNDLDDDTVRERYEVMYDDQPFLFIPQEITPSSYFMHTTQFGLLTINDILANDGLHSDDFTALELDPVLVLPRKSLSKAVGDYTLLPLPDMAISPDFMFQDLSYSIDMVSSYLDSLFTGKVGEWNENGPVVESCEEYTYEKLYDLSLFKDFLALHRDDHVRAVEYAYRGTTPDPEAGWPSYNVGDIPAGAIGTRGLIAYYDLSNYFPGENMEKTLHRRTGSGITDEIPSVFTEPHLSFNTQSVPFEYTSEFNFSTTDEISYREYYDNELTPNWPEIVTTGGYGRYESPAKTPHPKNFFLEVMEGIRGNEDRNYGVILTETDLLSVYSQNDYDIAQVCYTDSFYFHFYMLQAAKRLYSNSTTMKTRLNEFKMLRRHLIELLAERSRYETTLMYFGDTESERILKNAATLPRSEKAFALDKLNEYGSGYSDYSAAKKSKAGIIDIIDFDDPILIVNYLAELDDQIQAVLLDAQEKGCLETDMTDVDTNYVAAYDPDGVPSNVSDGTLMLHEPNLNYDKALCDWTPEMFSVAAEKLLSDESYEKIYDECKRITGNDFDSANIDNFQFRFPSDCVGHVKYAAWDPNQFNDHTVDTFSFREFETLVKAYPAALLDCDNEIQKDTLVDLTEAEMNYFDPVTGAILMSKSLSNYYELGGGYAGLNFGYALGWLYEGYDDVDSISQNGIDRSVLGAEVCSNTNFFAFGTYFAGGSFLKKDFTLCSAGSYASNKTADGTRPVPPSLADDALASHINSEVQAVASEYTVGTNYFMFIKNEKMTFTYDSSGWTENPVTVTYSQPYVSDQMNYQNNAATDDQMFLVEMHQSVPICGIISITIQGKVSGDLDADSFVTGDKFGQFNAHACKTMNFNFTPYIDFDGYASASVTAGISGVASISAGVDLGLKFVHVEFPYTANLSVSDNNGPAGDAEFNYDIWVMANNSLEQETTLLSGYFGAFVKLSYLVGSDTYHQKLFSWDGIKFNGTIDSLASPEVPFHAPIRALNGLANLRD